MNSEFLDSSDFWTGAQLAPGFGWHFFFPPMGLSPTLTGAWCAHMLTIQLTWSSPVHFLPPCPQHSCKQSPLGYLRLWTDDGQCWVGGLGPSGRAFWGPRIPEYVRKGITGSRWVSLWSCKLLVPWAGVWPQQGPLEHRTQAMGLDHPFLMYFLS